VKLFSEFEKKYLKQLLFLSLLDFFGGGGGRKIAQISRNISLSHTNTFTNSSAFLWALANLGY